MYEYGNARIAARRALLLAPSDLRRLSEAPTPGVFLAILDASPDFHPLVADVSGVTADPAAAVDTVVERHRSRRLGALPAWYDDTARRLVEAVVIPLDLERLVSILRHRFAGEPSDLVAVAVPPGALLTPIAIGRLARAPSTSQLVMEAARAGLFDRGRARRLAALPTGAATTEATVEAAVVAAIDDARLERSVGAGEDARTVRAVVEAEIAARHDAREIIDEAGAGAAAVAWRDERLSRLDRLARAGRRDPLGVGAVVGYVAAVEAQAIRIRAALAAVAAGWTRPLVDAYLRSTRASAIAGPPGGPTAARGPELESAWPASS